MEPVKFATAELLDTVAAHLASLPTTTERKPP
jgi:hypothetical protein